MNEARPLRSRRRLGAPAVTVLTAGLVITAAGAVLANLDYSHTEKRLTSLEARLSGLALTGAAATVQLQLAPAAQLASEGGTPAAVGRALASPSGSGGFTGSAVFAVNGGVPRLVASAGNTATIGEASSPEGLQAIEQATTSKSLVVTRRTAQGVQSLVYAAGARGVAGTFVAFAEQPVPGGHRVKIDPTNPGADLNFAIYFGKTESSSGLIETNAAHLPIGGTRASTMIPFGTASLTLVISARDSLAGGIAQYSTLLVVLIGILFTIATGGLVEHAGRRRQDAEDLARQNEELFEAQKSVAESLQHALLPKHLPQGPNLQVAVRYVAGAAGLEVGGDWYDAVEVDDQSIFFTVGDVAGRGLEAATLMGSLRNAINAYTFEGTSPADVLSMLGRLVDVAGDGRFATVICGRLDLRSGEVNVASAGHPRPLAVVGVEAEVLNVEPGPPIGVGGDYVATTIHLVPGSTLLAYTDGLVERRSESLNQGVERLRGAAARSLPLEQLLDHILQALLPDTVPEDDIALLGIRWTP